MKGERIAQTINLIYLENTGGIQYDERRFLSIIDMMFRKE